MDHLNALRKYLLLGQGDFVQHLMNLIGPTLDQPANTIFRHNLTGTLETVIRGGLIHHDNPDILKRLDVRLLEASKYETGWDVFSLDYHVDLPIRTILNSATMHKYLRLFNFLWRLKRAEHALEAGWKRQMTTAHALRGVHGIANDLHSCCVTCGEMVHFVYQMQYYMVFEASVNILKNFLYSVHSAKLALFLDDVLECSWDELARYVEQRRGDLDDLIAAHNTYLDNILKKALLVSGTAENVQAQFIGLFEIIFKFRKAQRVILCFLVFFRRENGGLPISFMSGQSRALSPQLVTFIHCCLLLQDALYDHGCRHVERRARLSQKAYQRTLQGKWGLTEDDEYDEGLVGELAEEDERELEEIRGSVATISKQFRKSLCTLLKSLSHNQDMNAKSLAVRLNYNEHYLEQQPPEQ
ncbi:MAG: LOW QUALITY PROTEIN: Spc98 family-domain-containing protein [Olpidium bornovanus]|uniref:Spc98 family-domain-containing protein n=1 Tax=Olpidium bornovanus TaxID=278681 RepID=A0A8H8A038_9FUNG|nr:MAG: LOW QUALITY PROTEIN: Spc98 family-domain-containing protein [Olpidium bornovanus]